MQQSQNLSAQNLISKDIKRDIKKKENKCVDGKDAFCLTKAPDGFIDSLKISDEDFFPNTRKLLTIGATSQVGKQELRGQLSGFVA